MMLFYEFVVGMAIMSVLMYLPLFAMPKNKKDDNDNRKKER